MNGVGVVVIVGVKLITDALLLLVAEALGLIGSGFRSRQGWQKHSRQDGDDRDDHKQFDQSEACRCRAEVFVHWAPDGSLLLQKLRLKQEPNGRISSKSFLAFPFNSAFFICCENSYLSITGLVFGA
jgi:hypothetical protein